MSIGKDDRIAVEQWGERVYKAIPKSVFAMAAWHLANACCPELDSDGATRDRFIEEIEALGANGIITQSQMKAALRALKPKS